MADDANLTPDWARLRDSDAAVHTELEELATAIVSTKSELISVVNGGLGSLDAARHRGLVQVTGDIASFSDPALRDQYLARHALSTFDWSTSEAVARSIAEVQHRTVGFGRRSSAGPIVLRLLDPSGNDLLAHIASLARAPAESRHSFWDLYSISCDVLPELDVAPDTFLDGIVPAVEESAGDGAAGLLEEAIRKWAARSPERSASLLLSVERGQQSTLLPIAILGLAGFDRDHAHHDAIRLATTGSKEMRAAALFALGIIPYLPNDPLLNEAVDHLEQVLLSGDTEYGPAVAAAYSRLARSGVQTAKDAMRTLATWGDSRTRYALAEGVFRLPEPAVSEEWCRDILFSLASTTTVDRGTFRFLDYCVERLAKLDPAAAVRFIELTARSNAEAKPDLAELLPCTTAVLHTSAARQLEGAITDWFASDDAALHETAAKIIQHHKLGAGNDRRDLELDCGRMRARTDEELVRLLRHAVGWVIGGAPLAAILTSPLRLPALSLSVAAFVQDALTNIALYNYPGGAGDYLRASQARGSVFLLEARVIRAALNDSDRYYEALWS